MVLRYRGYLPHLESPGSTYFVTFRLAGSLPQSTLERFRFEREDIKREAEKQNRRLSNYEIEKYLDELHGDCWLKNPEIAQVVSNALKYFDGTRYALHAWCIMPNHVHVVFTVISSGGEIDSDLIPILHSWKSFTSHKSNKILERSGEFWQSEYYDHLVRSEDEFAHYVEYTIENPVKAGLCQRWSEWPWTGCSEKVRKIITQ